MASTDARAAGGGVRTTPGVVSSVAGGRRGQGAPAETMAETMAERRRAPDGDEYTRAEFVAFFGGCVEWDAAACAASPPPTAPPPAAAPGRNRRRGRGGSSRGRA